MSISFLKVWENIHPDSEYQDPDDSPLLDTGGSSESLTAIRNGLHLRSNKDCGNFWDDFISVCSNSSALAALLGVSAEQVSSWPTKINKGLEKVKDDEDTEKKPELIHTGKPGSDDENVADQEPNYDANQPGQTRPI